MDGPQVAVWGPRLWRLFHSLAEKSGQIKHRLYPEDEKRTWLIIINGLRTAMPCPVCRQHFKEYLKTHPFEINFSKLGLERRELLRNWFWTFHNDVRLRKEQPIDITIEQVASAYTLYTKKEFDEDVMILRDHMRRGMFLRWLTRDDMTRILRALQELWCIVND